MSQANNPFESPVQPAAPTARASVPGKAKPAALTVFGVMNLIFGILGICGTAFGVFGLLVPMFLPPEALKVMEENPEPVFVLMKESSVYAGFLYCQLALGFIFSIVMIVSGVGLMKAKESGRKLAVVYAIYAILMLIAGLVMNAIFLFPMLMEQMNEPPPVGMTATINLFAQGFGAIIQLIYPALLLFFMTRQYIKDAVSK